MANDNESPKDKDTSYTSGTFDTPIFHNCLCKLLFLPIEIIMLPLTCLLSLSCWRNHRYFQCDFSIQLRSLFQTLIGAIWSSTLVGAIERYQNEKDFVDKNDEFTMIATSTYVICTYLMANIIIIILQTLHFSMDKISFFIGCLSQIVAFGIKDLSFEIMDIYFSNTKYQTVEFFVISFCFAIFIIIILSLVRIYCCNCANYYKYDANDQLLYGDHDEAANYSKRLSINSSTSTATVDLDTMNNQILSNQPNLSDIDEQNENKTKTKKNPDIAEKLLSLYAKTEIAPSLLHISNLSVDDKNMSLNFKKEEKKDEFISILKEMDTDIWMAAIGFIFIECIYFFTDRKWVPLDSSVVHSLNEKNDIVVQSGIIIIVSLFIVWILFAQFISYIQMIRDRSVYRAILHLKYHKNEKSLYGIDRLPDDTNNCCKRILIMCSLTSYNRTEYIITFINGALGWSFGWSVISYILTIETIEERVIYSSIFSVTGILLYWIRVTMLHNRLQKWLSIHGTLNKLDNCSLIDIQSKHHHSIYFMSHSNYFWRKSFALILAIPWQTTAFLFIQMNFPPTTKRLYIKLSIAIAATIGFCYAGLKFIKIERRFEMASNCYVTSMFIRGHHSKLKNVLKQAQLA